MRRVVVRSPLPPCCWRCSITPPPPAMALALSAVLTVGSVQAASRPNVIVIMADDIGAECLESYGSTIYTTPNLDRMAEEGVR